MSFEPSPDTGAMGRWLFFTNHMHVLTTLAERPDLRLRDIAREVGITERAIHRIISDLVGDGYLTRTRVGSRNRYAIAPDAPLRHPSYAAQTVGGVITALTPGDEGRDGSAAAGGGRPAVPLPGGGGMLERVFAAAPAAISVADESGRLVAVNPAFCELLQRHEHELVGQSMREFTHPDDVACDSERVSNAADGPLDYASEKRYVRADGTVTWVKVHTAASTDPVSGTPLIVAHAIEITERRRQGQALAEAEERFQSAFENAPIGMALVAPDGRFIKVNRSLCELTGYAETALLVRTFQDITHPGDLGGDLEFVEEMLAGRRRTYQMEKRYHHAQGHLIWVMLSVSLVRDDRGEPLYFISQIEGITERKRHEQPRGRQAAQIAVIAATDQLTGVSTAAPGTSP